MHLQHDHQEWTVVVFLDQDTQTPFTNPVEMSASNPATAKTDSGPSKPTPQRQQKKPLSTHLIAGGGAGFMEACVCHPLDTIKVRMQLRGKNSVRCIS